LHRRLPSPGCDARARCFHRAGRGLRLSFWCDSRETFPRENSFNHCISGARRGNAARARG
jgi:hypothetical protein